MRHTKAPLLLCILYVLFVGCHTIKEYSYVATDAQSFRDQPINAVTLKNGSIQTFNDIGGRFYEENDANGISKKKVIGFDEQNNLINLDLENILEVQTQVRSFNVLGTYIFIIGGIAFSALFIGALISSSGFY